MLAGVQAAALRGPKIQRMVLKNTQNTVAAPSVSSLKKGYAAGIQNITQRARLPTN